jgi:hypothetical protein
MTTRLSRKDLIKVIVANEMIAIQDLTEYNKTLRETYRNWEHKSSEDLCNKYNQIRHESMTVDLLSTDT